MSSLQHSTLVIATHNAGKLDELSTELAPLGWLVRGIASYGTLPPLEDGLDFEANAAIKAMAAMTVSGEWALADDSGLCVYALNGAPGLQTADYGGYERLLAEMQDVPTSLRTATFVCVLALARPGLPTLYFRGECPGSIAVAARGDAGFGYDPVFVPAGDARTFAEMSKAEKAKFSHRGQALRLFTTWLSDLG